MTVRAHMPNNNHSMDHLPCPIDGQRPSVFFYAYKGEYNPGDFFKIPMKYEFDDYQRLLEDGLYKPICKDAANEFVQSWLFFGLLSQVLGEKINYADFLTNDNTLHTKKLTYI